MACIPPLYLAKFEACLQFKELSPTQLVLPSEKEPLKWREGSLAWRKTSNLAKSNGRIQANGTTNAQNLLCVDIQFGNARPGVLKLLCHDLFLGLSAEAKSIVSTAQRH